MVQLSTRRGDHTFSALTCSRWGVDTRVRARVCTCHDMSSLHVFSTLLRSKQGCYNRLLRKH